MGVGRDVVAPRRGLTILTISIGARRCGGVRCGGGETSVVGGQAGGALQSRSLSGLDVEVIRDGGAELAELREESGEQFLSTVRMRGYVVAHGVGQGTGPVLHHARSVHAGRSRSAAAAPWSRDPRGLMGLDMRL